HVSRGLLMTVTLQRAQNRPDFSVQVRPVPVCRRFSPLRRSCRMTLWTSAILPVSLCPLFRLRHSQCSSSTNAGSVDGCGRVRAAGENRRVPRDSRRGELRQLGSGESAIRLSSDSYRAYQSSLVRGVYVDERQYREDERKED